MAETSSYRVNGENIRRMRTKQLITQQKLAELAGLSVTQVYRIEKQQQTPHFATIQKLAKALGVEAKSLVEVPELDGSHH